MEMYSIVNEFRIFRCAPDQIKLNVKYFHVFSENLAFLITKEDQVYGFGKQLVHYVAFYNKLQTLFDNIEKMHLITELCNKKIVSFLSASDIVMFARSSDNKIYGAGRNNAGQIGEQVEKIAIRPKKFKYFDDKNIIDISIGSNHCLALSYDGRIYGWGDNSCGQFGKMEDIKQPLSKPVQIKVNYIVKSICCHGNQTIVLSNDGIAYTLSNTTWSPNMNIGILNGVIKIMRGMKSIILVKNDTIIQRFNGYSDIFENITMNDEKVDLTECYFDNVRSALIIIIEGIIYRFKFFDDYLDLKELRNYNNMFDYSLFAMQITNYTVYINDNCICTKRYEMIDNKFSEKMIKIYEDVEEFRKRYEIKLEELRKLNEISIYNLIPVNLENNIEYFHMNGPYSSAFYSAYFVMNDKSVYVYGFNENGKLGLGNDDLVTEYTRNPYLSDKGIEEFFIHDLYCFARDFQSKIHVWGRNYKAILERGRQRYKTGSRPTIVIDNSDILRPEKISYFDDKSIIKICIGLSNFMALSSFGKVYGWGFNIWGKHTSQQGIELIDRPTEIKLFSDISKRCKSLDCGIKSFCALNTEGKVYFWSTLLKNCSNLSPFKTFKLKSEEIFKINTEMCAGNLFVLTTKGNLRKIEDLKITLEIDNENFSDMVVHFDDFVALQKDDGVYDYFIFLQKTNYCNFFDYFLHNHDIVKGTIRIRKDCFIEEHFIKYNDRNTEENQRILLTGYQNVSEEKYSKYFEEIEEIGKGSFGDVFKVKSKTDNQYYAIKLSQIDC